MSTTETPFEHVALEKQLCAACGGEGEWHPDKQALVCVFCGTVSPVEVDPESGAVQEIDLVRALREMPEGERGWQSERRSVRCQSCNAVSVFDPGQIGDNCDFCGATQLVDYEELKAPIRPESLLPFRVSDDTARKQARTWLRGRWFAPGSLKKKALEALRGVYLPYWTFDAQAFCPWTAEAGYYYYKTERSRDSKGRMRSRRVRHTRWKSVRGVIEHFFDDLPVPSTRGVDGKLLGRIEPFPTHELTPYEPEYLAGFLVEHYQVVLFDAFEEAKKRMGGELHKLCAREVPGDTHCNLEIQPEFSRQTFKHILLPVWLASFRYRKKAYQMLINGCTGEVAGFYPKSWWKILLAVLGVGAAVAVAVLLFNS